MRYLAYRDGEGGAIGLVSDDGLSVTKLAPIDTFYSNPFAFDASAASGPSFAISELTQLPPVPRSAKILCIGQNYPLHIAEMKGTRPDFPNIFARWYDCLSVDGDEVPLPDGEPGLDWEVELAAIVGRSMRKVSADEVMDNIFAYTCFNDLSARTHQRATSQWALGKNADGSGPIGPVVVTADELGDPYALRLQTRVNGDVMQDSVTGEMLFTIAEAISYASQTFTLRPGDVLATGTPSGVGAGMDPPRFLQAGDVCEVELENIGVLTTNII